MRLFLVVMVLLVAGQRLLELRISRSNERYLKARGAVEYGSRHYPVMVALHSAWLVSTLVEGLLRGPGLPVWWPVAFAAFVAVQPLRYWAITSLGRRWNTRILVLPGESLVASGPYRYLRHPNYVVVVAEIFALPMIFGAWMTAIFFTLANALLLYVRIRAEEAALDTHLTGGQRSSSGSEQS